MMSIKLIALDIDDTLLNSEGKLLDSTKVAVQKALAQGIKVVLCSGRPLAGVQPYLAALNITGDDQYVITYNGAVTEAVTGEVIAKHLVDNDLYRKMTAFGQEHQLPFNVLDEDSNIYTADRDVNWVTVIQAWENKAGLLIRDPDDLPADFQITKGVYVGDAAQLDELQPLVEKTFGADCYVVRAGSLFLEVMNPVVNKGAALRELAGILKLDASEVMACGDEKNDITMFDFAGTAVAMGNGSDEAKAHASYVTGTNDDGGLAAAIQKLALN